MRTETLFPKNCENATYTELQNFDFMEDATETLCPCLGNGSVWGGAFFITFELLINFKKVQIGFDEK